CTSQRIDAPHRGAAEAAEALSSVATYESAPLVPTRKLPLHVLRGSRAADHPGRASQALHELRRAALSLHRSRSDQGMASPLSAVAGNNGSRLRASMRNRQSLRQSSREIFCTHLAEGDRSRTKRLRRPCQFPELSRCRSTPSCEASAANQALVPARIRDLRPLSRL